MGLAGVTSLLLGLLGSSVSMAPGSGASQFQATGAGFVGKHLEAVSCPSSTYCVAVGILQTSSSAVPFADVSTDGGSSWTPGVLPKTHSVFPTLDAISCGSTIHWVASPRMVGFEVSRGIHQQVGPSA
jgi:hypothetical protein